MRRAIGHCASHDVQAAAWRADSFTRSGEKLCAHDSPLGRDVVYATGSTEMILYVEYDALLFARVGKCELVGYITQRERHGIWIVAWGIEVEHGCRSLRIALSGHFLPVAGAVRAVRTRYAIDSDLRGLGSLGHEHRVLRTVGALDGRAFQYLVLVGYLQLRGACR